ncbi:MAG: tetratricopeptide repeat protein, partial [Gemmatimonadetes bacterium]|nr:tetratricopeptide repeat protein [Gemmatimonadota bacterium]
EVLRLQGRLDEAEAAFRAAAQGGVPDRLTAQVNLAELLFRRGRTDDAMRLFDGFIDVYNTAGGRLTARDLVAVGRAVRVLARRDPDLFQDALRAFDEAGRADPGWAEPALRAGELFLEKYQSPEAQAEFAKVLAANPRNARALLGQARALNFDGSGGAKERLDSILALDPGHAEAFTLRARMAASREDWAAARADAARALRTDPSSLEALSVMAAAQYLSGERAAFEAMRRRVLEMNPRWSGLDATVAEVAVQVRRYQEAVERARAAVALDSLDWRSWGLLGTNQLRTGRFAEGRASLERAFRGDPYNPWFKNSLDLLDTFARFETVRTEHCEIFLHGSEAELLAPWVSQVAEEAYDSLRARYGADPPLPVRIELYPSHADFSVRTLGEPGLGALGVSFGSLLVLDSPAARAKGEYNWASTLWHEMSHAFHLAVSDHRVPRWFSEGLSVHEQRRAREGWGQQPTLPFLRAFREGRLKKVGELDDGFMRPDYPEQVIFSYYQASLLFQLLEERHGFAPVRAMLDGYRRGQSTEALLASAVSTTPEDLDRDFRAYVETRFAGALKALAPVAEAPAPDAPVATLEAFVRSHPGDLVGRLRLGARLVEEDRLEEARVHLTEALRMFPEYGGPDSPYAHLARIHAAQGDRERAAAALARLNALSESDYDALTMEAGLLEALGRPPEAARVLARAVQVWPYEPALHQRLAELAAATGDRALAVQARQAVVALHPVDRAEALYRLALAQRDAGDRAAARRSVLRALEVAPNFEPALELLLELRARGGAPCARRASCRPCWRPGSCPSAWPGARARRCAAAPRLRCRRTRRTWRA